MSIGPVSLVDVDARIASLVSPSALTLGIEPGLSNTRLNVPQGQIPLYMCTGDLSTGRYSCDMIRLDLRLDKTRHDDLQKSLLNHPAVTVFDDVSTFNKKPLRQGSYECLVTFKTETTSIRLGIGLVAGNLRIQPERGFLEWNPNKVQDDPRFDSLLRLLGAYVWSATLQRFDCAIDFDCPRLAIRLLPRDLRQKYQYFSSKNAVTEYLDERNKPGFVRLYDKAKEAGLPDDVHLTRLELVLGSDPKTWKFPILANFMEPFEAAAGKRGSLTYLVMAEAFSDLAFAGMDIDFYIRQLSRKARQQVTALLSSKTLEVDFEKVAQVLAFARQYEDLAGYAKRHDLKGDE